MNDYELWFNNCALSYSNKRKLLKIFKSAENIWCENIENKNDNFLNDKTIKKLKNAWNKVEINLLKKRLKENNIKTVIITDPMYPKQLKVYEDSPYMLFYKGDIKSLNEGCNVAIVGARKCSSYGINVCNIISKSLCINNINIVSGMARGIDSISHIKCIQENSYTCAVLGSGLDVIYPKENVKLYNKILEKGCIISQFAPGTKPYPYNFPIRNRIISGLSKLVVVIEGGKKSGSSITASAALEQGKDVIAVPGSIFSSKSYCPNELIKEGAYVFTDMKDIYNILNIKRYKKEVTNKRNMSPIEKSVYKNIGNTPIHIDDIAKVSNISIENLYKVLINLELNEEVMCLSGNYYVRNNKTIK